MGIKEKWKCRFENYKVFDDGAEDKLEVEIAKDTHITVIRGYVSAVLTKEEGKK